MIYVSVWITLIEALKVIGGSREEAQKQLCVAIADRAIWLQMLIVDRHDESVIEEIEVLPPPYLQPTDFNWDESLPLNARAWRDRKGLLEDPYTMVRAIRLLRSDVVRIWSRPTDRRTKRQPTPNDEREFSVWYANHKSAHGTAPSRGDSLEWVESKGLSRQSGRELIQKRKSAEATSRRKVGDA